MDEKHNISRIVELILGKLKGTLTPTERKEYDDAIRDNGLEKLNAKFEQPEFLVTKFTHHSKFDPKKAFAEFRRETSMRKQTSARRRVVTVAVAASIIIGVVTGLFISSGIDARRRENTMQLAKSVSPGAKRAQITLANGQVVELTDSAVDVTVEGVGSIKAEDGQIVYSGDQESAVSQVARNVLSVPRGGECTIELEDGTKVWLNSESKLEYPVRFAGAERRVKIEGEVLFDVAKNENVPFIVESPHITVTVRGTVFNIRDFADERSAMASLVSGRVEVDNAENTSKVTLSPGYQAVSRSGSGTLDVKKIDPGVITGWTENKFSFWHQDLEEVLADIARWYDIQVVYDKTYSGGYSLTGKIPRDSNLAEVLELLEMITDATFVFYDNTLTVGSMK